MEAAERDTTDEWRIAPGRAPATVAELEGRIDVALATARTAEEAALEIGEASLEAAEQARRAAALAERASAIAAHAVEAASTGATAPAAAAQVSEPTPLRWPVELRTNGVARRPPDPFDDRITAFRERAEKLMIRLQKIEARAPRPGPLGLAAVPLGQTATRQRP